MQTSIVADDVNEALVRLSREAASWPIEMRRGDIKMMDSPGPVTVEITNPRNRVLNVKQRNNSLPAACAETLWVLAGRNDVNWLQFYLPRAPDFSDDGKVWRAGYGPRLRNWARWSGPLDEAGGENVLEEVDQLDFVVKELKALPNSRRAVISLFDPAQDAAIAPVTFKDFPCNLTLSFMIRDSKLDLVVFCRSQDLIWGASGINWFEFTVMQELVADMIGVKVGTYYHVTNNLHVYSRHFELINGINNAYPPHRMPEVLPLLDTNGESLRYDEMNTVKDMDETLDDIFKLENDIRSNAVKDRDNLDGSEFFMQNRITFVGDMAVVMLAYCAYKVGNKELAYELQGRILDRAMSISYQRHIEWLNRPRVPTLSAD